MSSLNVHLEVQSVFHTHPPNTESDSSCFPALIDLGGRNVANYSLLFTSKTLPKNYTLKTRWVRITQLVINSVSNLDQVKPGQFKLSRVAFCLRVIICTQNYGCSVELEQLKVLLKRTPPNLSCWINTSCLGANKPELTSISLSQLMLF